MHAPRMRHACAVHAPCMAVHAPCMHCACTVHMPSRCGRAVPSRRLQLRQRRSTVAAGCSSTHCTTPTVPPCPAPPPQAFSAHPIRPLQSARPLRALCTPSAHPLHPPSARPLRRRGSPSSSRGTRLHIRRACTADTTHVRAVPMHMQACSRSSSRGSGGSRTAAPTTASFACGGCSAVSAYSCCSGTQRASPRSRSILQAAAWLRARRMARYAPAACAFRFSTGQAAGGGRRAAGGSVTEYPPCSDDPRFLTHPRRVRCTGVSVGHCQSGRV